jgi:hypothetical protein
MGTNTQVLALPSSPERSRRPTVEATVANFGALRPKRAHYDTSVPQIVLGRLLFGFEEERATPWATYDPDAVVEVRRDVVAAIAIARAASSSNDYADWFATQLSIADEVLAHASQHHEWVVAVFEGDVPCFLHGGTPHREPGDPMFEPHCALPEDSDCSLELPLGIAAGLVMGLGLVGWRYRRLSRR